MNNLKQLKRYKLKQKSSKCFELQKFNKKTLNDRKPFNSIDEKIDDFPALDIFCMKTNLETREQKINILNIVFAEQFCRLSCILFSSLQVQQ